MGKVVTIMAINIIEAGVSGAEDVITTTDVVVKIIFIMKTKKDLLILSNRHQTTSKINFRRIKMLLKVRTLAILLALLFRTSSGAYENLEFDQWNEIEQQMLMDACKIDNSHDIDIQ